MSARKKQETGVTEVTEALVGLERLALSQLDTEAKKRDADGNEVEPDGKWQCEQVLRGKGRDLMFYNLKAAYYLKAHLEEEGFEVQMMPRNRGSSMIVRLKGQSGWIQVAVRVSMASQEVMPSFLNLYGNGLANPRKPGTSPGQARIIVCMWPQDYQVPGLNADGSFAEVEVESWYFWFLRGNNPQDVTSDSMRVNKERRLGGALGVDMVSFKSVEGTSLLRLMKAEANQPSVPLYTEAEARADVIGASHLKNAIVMEALRQVLSTPRIVEVNVPTTLSEEDLDEWAEGAEVDAGRVGETKIKIKMGRPEDLPHQEGGNFSVFIKKGGVAKEQVSKVTAVWRKERQTGSGETLTVGLKSGGQEHQYDKSDEIDMFFQCFVVHHYNASSLSDDYYLMFGAQFFDWWKEKRLASDCQDSAWKALEWDKKQDLNKNKGVGFGRRRGWVLGAEQAGGERAPLIMHNCFKLAVQPDGLLSRQMLAFGDHSYTTNGPLPDEFAAGPSGAQAAQAAQED